MSTDYLATISPIRDVANEIEVNFKGAIVFIIDPDIKKNISTKGMDTLFNLTPAESQVCKLLLDGLNQGEIADCRNVGLETVRTQLKNVYQKTRTKKQSELIRLAVRCNPPIKKL